MAKTATQGGMQNGNPHGDYPLAGTRAQRLLSEALDKAQIEKGQSQRFISTQLGYKSSVVLSHMSIGRVPIPIDRAIDFARYLGMDQNDFLLAVLEQRHPDIDFNRLLGGRKAKVAKGATNTALADELAALAGKPLDELPMPQIRIMREVVQDSNAPRRWIAPHEVQLIETVRRFAPDGLTPAQNKVLIESLT